MQTKPIITNSNENVFTAFTTRLGHFLADVTPYYVLGNGRNDSTTFLEKITAGKRKYFLVKEVY